MVVPMIDAPVHRDAFVPTTVAARFAASSPAAAAPLRVAAPPAPALHTRAALSRDAVLEMLAEEPRDARQLAAAADALEAGGFPAASTPGPDTLLHGQGTWQVFNAPHIQRISSLAGADFCIRYVLLPGAGSGQALRLYSNVRYQHPLLGAGWLSASGSLSAAGDSAVQVHFDRFWVDLGGGEEDLRTYLVDGDDNTAGGVKSRQANSGDALVTALGRAAFLHQFAVFPVLALEPDEGLAMFRFAPLASNIAVVRISV